MAPFATYLIFGALIVYGVILLVELIRYKAVKRVAFQALVLVVVIAILHVLTDFPKPDRSSSYGNGFSPVLTIGVMFICTLIGIGARYFFYMKQFSWHAFLKPFCITPIVLLPLMGSVTSNAEITWIQLFSFAFLSFQNGFFWKAVFEQTRHLMMEGEHRHD